MTATLWWLAGAGVAAVADWIAVARGDRTVERVAKPAATVLLILAALAIEPSDSAQRVAFVVALCASLAGDVALLHDRFLAGLGAFLVAHLAFATGFVLGGLVVPLVVLGAVVAGTVAVAVGRTIVLSAGGDGLAVPVTVYLVVIAGMAAAATGSGDPAAVAGASLFVVSDALIGWRRFVAARAWMPVAIMVTYHAAQALLVLSLA